MKKLGEQCHQFSLFENALSKQKPLTAVPYQQSSSQWKKWQKKNKGSTGTESEGRSDKSMTYNFLVQSLKRFSKIWEQITNDAIILNIVSWSQDWFCKTPKIKLMFLKFSSVNSRNVLYFKKFRSLEESFRNALGNQAILYQQCLLEKKEW